MPIKLTSHHPQRRRGESLYRRRLEASSSTLPRHLRDGDPLPEDHPIPPGTDLYKVYFHLTAEGIWRIDFDPAVDTRQPIEAQVEAILSRAVFGDCNRVFAEMNGFASPEEVRGLRLDQLLDPAFPGNRDLLQRVIISNYRLTNDETSLVDELGKTHWFLVNYYGVIEDGQLQRIWGTQQEITERKRNDAIQTALYQISQATNSTQNLQQLYRSIHQILGGLMPANNFFIALHDPADKLLHFPYFVDEVDEPPPLLETGRGLTEYVLRTGKPLLADPDDFNQLVAQGEVESVGAPSIDWMGVPLVLQNETIGVLAVQTYTEGVRYSQADLDVLMFVSTQVAMAIDRKRAEETLRINEARYRAIVEDQTELISRFRAEDYALTFVNEAYCRYFGKTQEELLGKSFLPMVPPEHQPILISMLASLTPQNPVVTSENRGLLPGGATSWEQWSNRAIFDENGRIIEYQSVGRDITDRKRVEDELRYLSTHDRLTGIYNRAYFEDELTRLELGRQFPVSIIVADVDGLKEANDTYGHTVGDEVLRHAAEALKNAFRGQDVVARIGGDEFGILLPGADVEVARASLFRVRHNLELRQSRLEVPVELSMGFATATYSSELADAYKQADTMMYQEKFQARNRRIQASIQTQRVLPRKKDTGPLR